MENYIRYESTNRNAPKVSFAEALLKGLAPDRGLYMPDSVPVIDKNILAGMRGLSYPQIALTVARHLLKGEIADNELVKMTADAYNFPVPLEKVTGRKYIMRLDQGPTASFKDFAARMMGRLMQHFLQKENRNMLILTATSGDTGSAIANAFYGLSNIRVVILYPEREVTSRQRKQMTTLQKNISIVALDGKFDDCQALVKQAFTDPGLDYLELSSANSINIGRLLPQSFYYFYAWSQLARSDDEEVIFSVPSGNFGNLMGGLLASRMGLPVKKFVISTNENDEVPVYWQTGIYKTVVPSRNCISSAMNVGHPSNMSRVISLYNGIMDETGSILKEPDTLRMHKEIAAFSITDQRTVDTIRSVHKDFGTIIEPHGAAGWAGLSDYLQQNEGDESDDQLCISLETAHPAKFPEEIRKVLNLDPPLPQSLAGLDDKEETFDRLPYNYDEFKKYLIGRF
jgi:threonine synthase